MARLLKDLQINDVSSVDRGAGEGVRVMLMKNHKGNDMDSNLLDQICKSADAGSLPRAVLGEILNVETQKRGGNLMKLLDGGDKLISTLFNKVQELGRQQGYGEPDHVTKGAVDEASSGGQPPGSKAGTAYQSDDDAEEDPATALETLVTAHVAKNPGMKRTLAHDIVRRTPKGKALATRAITSGVSGYRNSQRTHGIGVASDLRPDLSRA